MSEVAQGNTPDTLRDKYLSFFLEDNLFGMPLEQVREIIKLKEITPVPEYPYYAKGIILNKGIVVPVMDLRLRLGLNSIEYDDKTCIVIVKIQDIDMGFIVDSVADIANIQADKLSPPPSISTKKLDNYILSTGDYKGKVIIILDGMKILSEEDIDTVKKNTK